MHGDYVVKYAILCINQYYILPEFNVLALPLVAVMMQRYVYNPDLKDAGRYVRSGMDDAHKICSFIT